MPVKFNTPFTEEEMKTITFALETTASSIDDIIKKYELGDFSNV